MDKSKAVFHETIRLYFDLQEEKTMATFNCDFFKGENGNIFFVRPFSEEVRNDLDRLAKDARKASYGTTIIETDGTYAISTNQVIDERTFVESFWGMLFRRFLSESKRVCVDPISNEKFYAVILSGEFILPCERKLAA